MLKIADERMSEKPEGRGKIPEKFDDNVVLFLCRGPDRRKVRFRKRDVPKFKHEVLYANNFFLFAILNILFTFARLQFLFIFLQLFSSP